MLFLSLLALRDGQKRVFHVRTFHLILLKIDVALLRSSSTLREGGGGAGGRERERETGEWRGK